MTTLEELGLLKMDFLGLRTLTVLSDAEKWCAERNRISQSPMCRMTTRRCTGCWRRAAPTAYSSTNPAA